MDNEYFVELSHFSCDSCGSKEGPTATYHCRGVPVLSNASAVIPVPGKRRASVPGISGCRGRLRSDAASLADPV